MARILNIETATRNCSVALADSGKTIASRDFASDGYTHAEKLHVFIREVLAEGKMTFSALDAIAVGRGPGSYTGLRIGVAASKGLCYGLNIPLIAVDTLQVLAKQATITNGIIVPMLDARRMEVYSAVFNSKYEQITPTIAEILNENSYSQYSEPVFFLGDCQEKVKAVLSGNQFIFLPDLIFPSAINMGEISYLKYQEGNFEPTAYFEPFYLKDFILGSK